MSTSKLSAVLGGLVLALFGFNSARAETTCAASYASQGHWGTLTVSAEPGSQFTVWGEQVDGSLLQHPGANALLDVPPCLVLGHDAGDPLALQQVREQKPDAGGLDEAQRGMRVINALFASERSGQFERP